MDFSSKEKDNLFTGIGQRKVQGVKYLVAEFKETAMDCAPQKHYKGTYDLFTLQRAVTGQLTRNNSPETEENLYENVKAYNALKEALDANPDCKASYNMPKKYKREFNEKSQQNFEKGFHEKYKDIDFKYEPLLDYD